METDSDGVYEAHITKADGTASSVEVGSDYAVTGEEAGGHGSQGRHGDGDHRRRRAGNDADDAATTTPSA